MKFIPKKPVIPKIKVFHNALKTEIITQTMEGNDKKDIFNVRPLTAANEGHFKKTNSLPFGISINSENSQDGNSKKQPKMKKNIKGNDEVVAAIPEGFAQNNEILRAILVYMSRNLTEIKNGNKKKMGKLD